MNTVVMKAWPSYRLVNVDYRLNWQILPSDMAIILIFGAAKLLNIYPCPVDVKRTVEKLLAYGGWKRREKE